MELIGRESAVPDAVLLTLYEGHRDGLLELTGALEQPLYAVTDPARLAMARSFGHHLLALLESDLAPGDRESLRRRVNLTYEAGLILLDYLKNSTAAPKVPSRKRAAAAAPDGGPATAPAKL